MHADGMGWQTANQKATHGAKAHEHSRSAEHVCERKKAGLPCELAACCFSESSAGVPEGKSRCHARGCAAARAATGASLVVAFTAPAMHLLIL